nr:WG repeat-containing protein [Pedobacter cryoconitis]
MVPRYTLIVCCIILSYTEQVCAQIGLNNNQQLIPFIDQHHKWGYLDAKTGIMKIKPKYDFAALFNNGQAVVGLKNPNPKNYSEDRLEGLIDETGKEIFAPQFTGRYEVKTRQGNILPQLIQYTTADGKTGIAKTQGGWLMEPGKYESFEFYDQDHYLAGNVFFSKGKRYTPPKNCVIETVDMEHRFFYTQRDSIYHGVSSWEGKTLVSPVYLDVKYIAGPKRFIADRLIKEMTSKNIQDELRILETEKQAGKDVIYNYLLDDQGKELKRFSSQYEATVNNKENLGIYERNGHQEYFDLLTGNPVPVAKVESVNGFHVFQKEQRYGIEDEYGKEILSPKYDKINFINPGFIIVTDHSSGKTGVIDIHQQQLVPFLYGSLDGLKDGKMIAYKDNKYGMINTKGQVLIDFKYKLYFYFDENGMAEVYDDKHGVIDTTGKTVIPLVFNTLFNTKTTEKTEQTYYTAEKNGRWGLMDDHGKVLIPFEYGYVSVGAEDLKKGWVNVEDTARIKRGAINILTGTKIPADYDIVRHYNSFTITGIRKNNDYQYSLLSAEAKPMTSEAYDKLDYTNGYLLAQIGKKYGVMDTSGKVLIPFTYDYLWAETPSLLLAEKDGRQFYINISGKKFIHSD